MATKCKPVDIRPDPIRLGEVVNELTGFGPYLDKIRMFNFEFGRKLDSYASNLILDPIQSELF